MLINCDIGEREPLADIPLLPFIDIANIACGGHAGSKSLAKKLFNRCCENEILVSNHIGYEDKENFGRIELNLSPSIIIEQTYRQRDVLPEAKGLKFHGALYNRLWYDVELADRLFKHIAKMDFEWVLAPFGSQQAIAAESIGLEVKKEVFAERGYQWKEEGYSLLPRTQNGAVLDNLEEAFQQGKALLQGNEIKIWNVEFSEFQNVILLADSICVHSDAKIAYSLLKLLKSCELG